MGRFDCFKSSVIISSQKKLINGLDLPSKAGDAQGNGLSITLRPHPVTINASVISPIYSVTLAFNFESDIKRMM